MVRNDQRPAAIMTVEHGSTTPRDFTSENGVKAEKLNQVNNLLRVDWDGPDDPQNPKNWTSREKWLITLVISSFYFISPVSSSMVAPASGQIAQQFNISNSALLEMSISIFVLGFSFGPLVRLLEKHLRGGPLSEIYGRSRVLQCSNLFYFAWNLACGFAQNKNQLIIFRFLAGLGGSAPIPIGGGVIGDIWRPEERGKAIALYSLAPLLGPAIGPLCGGWIAERSTWRWVFWSTTIADALIQIFGLLFLRETYAPVLLERKARRLRKDQEALGDNPEREILTFYDSPITRSWGSFIWLSMTRPFQLFVQEAIIQVLGIYLTFVYGILYLFIFTIPQIFAVYNQGLGIGGLHYIALGLGLTGASQCNALLMDRIYVYFKNRNGGIGEPEFRLPTMIPATLLLPIGLFLSGWAAENKIHWIVVDIGTFFVGISSILANQCIQTYVVDAYTLHAASALAAVSFLRYLAAFGFPLFAPAMYAQLGYGKGDTVLACVAIGLGCPAPVLLWKYGRKIRASSKYARKEHLCK